MKITQSEERVFILKLTHFSANDDIVMYGPTARQWLDRTPHGDRFMVNSPLLGKRIPMNMQH
jgi:hypothetical protein